VLIFREVKTSSGKTAVQVYYLQNRKRHLGSASTLEEVDTLKEQALHLIEDYSRQAS
jgi:hypothetical protein